MERWQFSLQVIHNLLRTKISEKTEEVLYNGLNVILVGGGNSTRYVILFPSLLSLSEMQLAHFTSTRISIH
jgi:hypothetical protein